jgi:hypothetical protein
VTATPGKAPPTVKTKTFQNFQRDLYPIIDDIARDLNNQSDNSVKRWQQAQSGRTKITSATTLCTLQ